MLKNHQSRHGYYFLTTVTLLLTSFVAGGCGGGGGGGGSSLSPSTVSSASFGDLSGDTDPDGDGTILVDYYLYSSISRGITIALEFSTDGGTCFFSCTEDTSETLGGDPNETEGLIGLSATPAGAHHVFAWDSDSPNDLPGQNLSSVMLRITFEGFVHAQSEYFVVLNDRGETVPPTVESLTATAVANSSNDTLAICFDEPVNQDDAKNLSYYALENPESEPMAMPAGSTVAYDPVLNTATITLDGDGDADLRFGASARIEVSGVRDLMGNEIVTNPDGIALTTVVGDGTNLPDDQPDLVLAVFYSSGSPSVGKSLILLFDEDMSLDNGTFEAADVDFWHNGDTVGWGPPLSLALLESEPKAVHIQLGLSPSFVPGSSLINVSRDNDSIIDLAGNNPWFPAAPTYDDFVEIISLEYQAPVIDLLTVNDIPQILNGDGAAGGTILVPRTGFDINATYHDEGDAGVDIDTFVLACSVPVTVDGDTKAAGTDLIEFLTVNGIDEESASFTVPAGMIFETGPVTFRATIDDLLKNESNETSYTCEVRVPTAAQLPFRTNVLPCQRWKLLFGRDLYTISVSGSSSILVTSQMQANGVADFAEDLIIFGINCNYPITIPGVQEDSNEFVRRLVIDAVKNELSDVIYEGANIVFSDSTTAVFPGNAPQVGYNQHGESLMAIGGDSDVGALGCAFIDRCNVSQDNDGLYKGSSPYNPGTNLGVFTTRIFAYEVNGSSYGLFRLTYDDFIPGRGVPVGTDADDEEILMDIAGTGPSVSGGAAIRRDAILGAVARLARFIAVVGAHEMGHSMGLSVDGAMPNGLYGGDSLHFPGSTSYHINLGAFPELFISPNVNIMTPMTNFTYTNGSGTRFNRLNEAYFKEKTFYLQ